LIIDKDDDEKANTAAATHIAPLKRTSISENLPAQIPVGGADKSASDGAIKARLGLFAYAGTPRTRYKQKVVW
jgi:hypothetical protein